jgi:hypothetical protein
MANYCNNTLTITPTNRSKAAKIQFNEFIGKVRNVGEIIKPKDAKEFREKYIEDNFENIYRDDAEKFVLHSEMNINKFMTSVLDFTMVGKGIGRFFIRNNTEFTMETLMPCPEELVNVTSPLRAENGEDEKQFKKRIARHKKLYGATDCYQWNCDNRGCKWDVFDVYIGRKTKNEIIYHYTTAWSPNDGFINHIAPQFPLLDIHLEYEEPGCGFAGETKYVAGELENDGSWGYVQTSCCECGEEVDEGQELNDEGRCNDCAELEEQGEENE